MTEKTLEELKAENVLISKDLGERYLGFNKEYAEYSAKYNTILLENRAKIKLLEEEAIRVAPGRQEAVQRVSDLTLELEKLLEEAEEICDKFSLSFNLDTRAMYNTLRYTRGAYDGWESSSC